MISEARIHSFSATATLSAVTSTKNWLLRFVNKFFNNFVIFLFLYRKQDSSAEIVTRSFKTPQIQKVRFSTFHPLVHKRKQKTSVKWKLKALLSLLPDLDDLELNQRVKKVSSGPEPLELADEVVRDLSMINT